MSDLDIFKDIFVPNIESFNKLNYTTWKRLNPGEAARWEPYRDAILTGQSPVPPSMLTKFGKALVAAGELVTASISPPPLPSNVARSQPSGKVTT